MTFDKYTKSYGAGSISAAPEPAAWALMLFGVGGMGAAMRSAKRKQFATA